MDDRLTPSCTETGVQLTLYMDGELGVDEIQAVEAHLKVCQSCQKTLIKERRFNESIQRTAPLYVAPDELRTRITSMLEHASVHPPERERRRRLPLWLSGVAATLATVLVLGGLWVIMPIDLAPSSAFADIAVDTHQRHTLGRLPLELISDSPDEISNWFGGKVPFSLKLPNYQDASGQKKLYQLKGARLIGLKGDYAAYIRYEMGSHPISLVVTSSDIAEPEGGEQILSKGLVIHYESISGLKVLTWGHRGLTYALVSDLEERGQQSCLVCHQGAKDEDFMGGLDSI